MWLYIDILTLKFNFKVKDTLYIVVNLSRPEIHIAKLVQFLICTDDPLALLKNQCFQCPSPIIVYVYQNVHVELGNPNLPHFLFVFHFFFCQLPLWLWCVLGRFFWWKLR